MREVLVGQWVLGQIEAHDIPTKTVVFKSGIHESTMSRFFNGIKGVSDKQLFKIGVAVGEARAEQRHKRSDH